MKKQIIMLIWGILLIGIVAGVMAFNLKPAKFTPDPIAPAISYSGDITFNCGKKSMSVHLEESNLDIDDDFERAVRGMCVEEITNIRDWNGRTYQENNYGLRSFDEDKLREDECRHLKKDYDKSIQECVDITRRYVEPAPPREIREIKDD